MVIEIAQQDSSPLAHSVIRGLIQLRRIGSIVAVLESHGRTTLITMDLHAARMVSCCIDKRVYVIPAALLEKATDVHISVLLSVVNFLSDRTSPLYHMAIFLGSRLRRPLESLPSVETWLLLHLLLVLHRVTRIGLPHISH